MAAFQERMQGEHKELLRSNSLATLLMMQGGDSAPPADLVERVLATTPPACGAPW